MVKFDVKRMSESESKYKINNGYIKIREQNLQSSYNLSKKFCDYVKEKNILVENPDLDYSRKDKDGNAYVLNGEYQLELGPGILWLIGKEYSNKNNKFIASHNANGKMQVYNAVYKNMSKMGYDGYEWFPTLYEKSIAGNVLVIDVDEDQKKFTVDIRFDSLEENRSHIELDPIEENLNHTESDSIVDNEINLPHNRIIFGAPGTGKSFELNKDKEKFNDRYERVTFHPNYSYSQFVGTYKPVPVDNNDGNKTNDITYEYVPGPFMRAYVKSMKSKKPYLLLIEEINRANVTSVFGDIFQLLDRKEGISEYPIETSKDMRDYLDNEFKKRNIDSDPNRITIPENMYIWASMNSADQGVFPMDTAFKRRWEFEYIGINDNSEKIEDIIIGIGADKHPIKWNDLRTAINNKLSGDYKINEDKLLGPYFLSKDILEKDYLETQKWNSEQVNIKNNDKFLKAFKNKVLMYLFEDVAKQYGPKLFEGCEDPTKYSSICKEFDQKGEAIFGDDFIKKYADK